MKNIILSLLIICSTSLISQNKSSKDSKSLGPWSKEKLASIKMMTEIVPEFPTDDSKALVEMMGKVKTVTKIVTFNGNELSKEALALFAGADHKSKIFIDYKLKGEKETRYVSIMVE